MHCERSRSGRIRTRKPDLVRRLPVGWAARRMRTLAPTMRSLSTRLEAVEDQLDDALDELAALRRRAAVAEAQDTDDQAGARERSEA